MIYKISDNILSPLGDTTEMNYRAVIDGKSRLRCHENIRGIRERFTASLFDSRQIASIEPEGPTFFEAVAIHSIRQALSDTNLDISGNDTILILSTTKANIADLENGDTDSENLYPGKAAQRIALALGMTTTPITVCNACISGLEAIILAQRLLDRGTYNHAIVCGADVQSHFIVSGFSSLKALSPSECRPFDIERTGLNLGEAAATMIFSNKVPNDGIHWRIQAGAVRNDAVHISTPSKKGEGLKRALLRIMSQQDKSDLAIINAHGTATLFNDQMEAVAIREAGLTDIPVDALKGYYGHTMGASGILETILTMRALDDGIRIGTRGFEELGVSARLSISNQHRTTDKHSFIKTLSGFGGCNAAILAKKSNDPAQETDQKEIELTETHRVTITPKEVTVDGKKLQLPEDDTDLLAFLYRQYVDNYPKFHKMDRLCRLGFVASELLLDTEKRTAEESEDRAVVLFNRSSSVYADRKYLQSITNPDDYYPSPSAFVYTLPNIVTGEIAIRNHYHGQTSFYILPERDDKLMRNLQKAAACDPSTRSLISGWIDYENDKQFVADIYLLTIKQ